MASLHKEIIVEAACEVIWDAVRDIGALHTRLVPGFVKDTKLEGEVRVVTFGNGMVMREPIISVDDARRRLVWGAEGGRTTHYNAVMQVFSEGPQRSRVCWTSDLLPHEMAEPIGQMQELGLATLKQTLERALR
jgi:hypothetical protein